MTNSYMDHQTPTVSGRRVRSVSNFRWYVRTTSWIICPPGFYIATSQLTINHVIVNHLVLLRSHPPIMAVATVYLQDACYKHQYIRTPDLSCIVERPERIRAVKVGVAGAVAQADILDESRLNSKDELGLEEALERLNISSGPSKTEGRIKIRRSTASVDLLTDPAVKFVHGDVDGDKHVPRIVKLARESAERIRNGESEIPEALGWKQGDVYCAFFILIRLLSAFNFCPLHANPKPQYVPTPSQPWKAPSGPSSKPSTPFSRRQQRRGRSRSFARRGTTAAKTPPRASASSTMSL